MTISRRGKTSTVELDPKGVIVGRGAACDVVLESGHVSRHHARIFRDPFGRWIIEDMGSRNGVWLEDQRVEASALLPGEKVVIGPFSLALSQETGQQIAPGTGMLVVTDGITESAAPSGEQFGTERLREAAEAMELGSAEAMVQSITRAASEFRQPLPQQDDVTVFAMVYHGPESAPGCAI